MDHIDVYSLRTGLKGAFEAFYAGGYREGIVLRCNTINHFYQEG
jgi:hypothetical protein